MQRVFVKLLAVCSAALSCIVACPSWARGDDDGSAVESPSRAGGAIVASAVDPYDDTIWAATDDALLLQVAHDGTLLHRLQLPVRPVAVAVDLDESVWITGERDLLHVSRAGAPITTLPLELDDGERANALVVDGVRGVAWVGTTTSVLRVAMNAREPTRHPVGGATRGVAVDPQSGTALAITDDALVVVDGGRARVVDFTPTDDEHLLSIAFDARHGAFAVTTTLGALRVRTSPSAVERRGADDALLDAQPFRVDPAITLVRPPSGGAITERTERIVVQGAARCNDAPCAIPDYLPRLRISATFNGRALADERADEHGLVQWALTNPSAGRNEFTALAVDRFGHSAGLEREHWTLLGPAGDATERTLESAQTQTKAANKPPTVTLTSPASGSTFTIGGTITLTADASDADGSVVKVEFYRGGTTLIGTATAAPYKTTWTPTAANTYSLTAKAYDNRNGSAVSSPVSVVIASNQPPTVALASPAPGAFLPVGSSALLVANVADADGTVTSVDFFDGAVSLGTIRSPPFQLSWTPASAGVHTLRARATDDKGATSDFVSIDVTVGEPPVVVVTGPVACSTLDGPLDVILAADAMTAAGTIARVDFFDNGAFVGSSFASPWSALLHAQRGTHSITAYAVDDHGLGTTSRAASLTVRAPNVPPTVALTAPSDGLHVPIGAGVSLAATASDSDGTIAAVEFRRDNASGTLIARVTSAPYAASWPANASGSYTFVAVAIDDANASATSAPVHVVVDANVPPTVALTSPVPDAQYAAPATIGLTASASDPDGTIAKVEFFSGSTLIGSSTASPFSATWTGVGSGTYALTAKATDNGGASTSSTQVPIVVTSNSPPTVTVTVAGGASFFAPATITLSASATDRDGSVARVEFYANATLIGDATTAPYGMVWDGVAGGSYAVTAKAIDDAGATAVSTPVNVSVQGAPTLAFDSQLAGASISDDRVLVRGFVSAPANSAVTVNGRVTHIDDAGLFQANDVPLLPGTNEIVAVVTTQDGQTTTKTVTVDSSGPGAFLVDAAPTEGLETLQVTFTLENPQNRPFNTASLDIDSDGNAEFSARPDQFQDGKLSVTVTYPPGTWLATIRFVDDQGRVLYETRKSIVVFFPERFQANVRAVYDNMLMRLRTGNVAGALTAFTGSAYDKYSDIFGQLQPSLAEIVDQLGTVTEVTFNFDMAELTLIRNDAEGARRFMIYVVRSEDGIWRIDGM